MSRPACAPMRVFACRLAALEDGGVVAVRLSPDASGRPREAIILFDSLRIVRAYVNLCRHLPIPLDAASRDFVRDGQLQCATHGARYRLQDGLCVAGPCRGASLFALEVHIEGDDVFVDDPAR